MGNKLIKCLKDKELLKNIERGFVNSEFKMHLQFIVDNKTKNIALAEALSRWETVDGNVLLPGAYLGIMEKSGYIIRFDYYMFEQVCAQLSQWKDTMFKDVSISCNITRITISEKDFVEKIKAIISKYDFNRKNLIVEITEDCIEKNLEIAKENILKVKELGFTIALDDMGSGYASLISLCEYPIDILKIDRDVLLLTNEERGKKLFLGIVSLAHYLNISVVCEGVETQEQNQLVSESDCDFIQGWYYTKALPMQQAEDFYKKHNGKIQ